MQPKPLLTHDNLTDAVIQEIEAMILRGEARPGDWLMPQPELAAKLGVGLSTIREAVKGLTLIGILHPQPGRGTWINADAPSMLRMLNLLRSRLGDLDLPAIYEARRLLEAELTALAASRATPEDIERIGSALGQMRQSIGDSEAFTAADQEFHFAVVSAAHSPLLEQFYHITAEMSGQINRQIADLPGVKEPGLQLQEAIYAAIRAHNTRTARQRALELMDRWYEILRTVDGASVTG
jgi:GntR family transcriptional repressor for pyruvate dehydrogenase complex